MFLNIETKDSVQTAFLRMRPEIVLGVKKVNCQVPSLRSPARKPQGFSIHVVVSGMLAAARNFQQELAVAGSIVKAGAAGQPKHLEIRPYALIFKTVCRDGKQIELGIFPVPRSHLLG